jgi:hypothetical protein
MLKISDAEKRKKINNEGLHADTCFIYNLPHSEECKPQFEVYDITSTSTVSQITQYLTQLIYKDPFKTSFYFRDLLIKESNTTISIRSISELLNKIRKELFPVKVEELIQQKKFLTLDEDVNKKQDTLLYYILYPIPIDKESSKHTKKRKLKRNSSQSLCIASKFMLTQLCLAKRWFIDGTFRSSPKEFSQLLVILVQVEQSKLNIPVCYIALTSKNTHAYSLAFRNLKLHLESIGLNPQVEEVVMDFELAMRNGFLKVWPLIKIKGCFFHYCKALWHKASALGLLILAYNLNFL